MRKNLRKVTLYLSEEELAEVKAVAEDEGATISAVVRAHLGLAYKGRGAPQWNTNRQRKGSTRGRESVPPVIKPPEVEQAFGESAHDGESRKQ